MPLVELLVHESTIMPGAAKWEADMSGWIMCYDTLDFPCEDLFQALNPHPKPQS